MKDNLTIFILAGGFGTRLREVINTVPKPMAPVINKPFLEYQINEIRKNFPNNKIFILTHYMSDIIETYFKNDNRIQIIKEEIPLGTGGSIKNAINRLSLNLSSELIVFNGDTYTEANLIEMIDSSFNDVNLLASFQDDCSRYGSLTIENFAVKSFNEKKINANKSYINAGCYYFKNLKFFESIKEEKFSIEKKFISYIEKEIIGAFLYKEIFIDIGIPEDYKKMIEYIREKNEHK